MEFTANDMNVHQKAGLIGSLFLIDYMFFERDQGMCEYRDDTLYITCCLCYCFGCLCPCRISAKNSNN